MRGLDSSLTTAGELRVAGEYAVRFMRFQQEFYFKRARETFRPMRKNYQQGPRAYLKKEAYFKNPIDVDEIEMLLDMVNIDPETRWHEGLGNALELMGFVYDFNGTDAGILLPAALAENIFKDLADAVSRIKDNILLRNEPQQLELDAFARYKLPEGSAGTPRESEEESGRDAGKDSEMGEDEENRAPSPGSMAPPLFIPPHRREAAGEGGEANNPATNRPPIARQDPQVRPRPDSEDEAMLQDAVTWNPGRKPAKPTMVVRKAVIDDLWNKRGQLCRDWWEKAGARKKLVINKIEKCLGEECPRQWTGEYYITDLATPIQWLQGINWGHSCDVCCAWWMGSLKVAVENEPPYPRPGATCWICSK